MKPSPSAVVFDALFRLIEESSAASVAARTGLGATTISRWWVERKSGKGSFNARSFDDLMKLDEVRAALVAALRELPEESQAAWEAIGARLSKVISPAVGWRLANILEALAEMDLLDSQLRAIEALASARQSASVEKARAAKLASRKAKTAPVK